MRARAVAIRGFALATLIVVASWLAVPAWLPRSEAIPVAAAAGCKGASHHLAVKAPSATPKTGTTLTTITFTVVVTDTGGCLPTTVLLRIPGQPLHTMAASGGSIKTGLTYRGALQLPQGVWSWGFHVENGTKAGHQTVDVTGSGTLRITSPATPTPTPKPTPKPTPTPTPRPTASPTPKPTATPRTTPAPTPRATSTARTGPTPKTGPGPTPRPSPSPGRSHWPSATPPAGGGSTGSTGSSGNPGDPGATSAPLGLGPLGPADRDHGPLDDGTPSASPPPGGMPVEAGLPGAAAATSAASPFDPTRALPVLLWGTTSTLGVVLFAFLMRRSLVLEGTGSLAIFAMDRRRRQPADRRPVAAAAVAVDPAPAVAAAVVPALEAEAAKPVVSPWAARTTHEARRFDRPAGRGVERRTVGYRQVRVSAGPDDVRTPEVGRVDRGDEIELIGEDASFFLIRTPDGVEGWVPRFVILGI